MNILDTDTPLTAIAEIISNQMGHIVGGNKETMEARLDEMIKDEM